MKDITKSWMDAGKLLGRDENALVLCPECKNGILLVKNEGIPSHTNKIDRYMICNQCGKWNVLTMQME